MQRQSIIHLIRQSFLLGFVGLAFRFGLLRTKTMSYTPTQTIEKPSRKHTSSALRFASASSASRFFSASSALRFASALTRRHATVT
jgi:hypothetical protein